MDDKRTITVEELQEKLNRKERVFIIDVRPADQRQEWHIAESVHVDAYHQLKAGDETALDMVDIPANATLVTVCAAGRTSLLASGLLRKKGIEAYSLDGGMRAWNYAWNKAETSFENGLKIIQVRRAAKGCLSYVAGSGGEAIVVDAALDPAVYMELAKKNGWKITHVLDTHIHADYISRTRELALASGATHMLPDTFAVDFPFAGISDGARVSFGKTFLEVIFTPGHTPESASFRIGDHAILTGDTLFTDGVGRPDLKADHQQAVQKSRQLFHSIKKLLSLSPSLQVLPAHSSSAVAFDSRIIATTLGELKKLALLNIDEREFVHYTTTRIPPTPPNYMTIASINRHGSYESHVPADLEAGGNHCAIK